MTCMNFPESLVSLAVEPVSKDSKEQFSKALNRLWKEDPTFRVWVDPESGQTIISGMGELHLDICVDRIRREYKVDVTVGKPRVIFKESVTQRADFDYLHKKQSGGRGQYGRVKLGILNHFQQDRQLSLNLKTCLLGRLYHQILSQQLRGVSKMLLTLENLRVVLTDGAAHAVDSSELAFRAASIYAFNQCYAASRPVILEPVMLVELKVPTEFKEAVAGDINKRKGVIVGNDQEGDGSVITAHVPLNNMFGYSTEFRSMTQGRGVYSMEYKEYSPVSHDVQTQLINNYKSKAAE